VAALRIRSGRAIPFQGEELLDPRHGDPCGLIGTLEAGEEPLSGLLENVIGTFAGSQRHGLNVRLKRTAEANQRGLLRIHAGLRRIGRNHRRWNRGLRVRARSGESGSDIRL
jgi:hypothetical protein